MVVKSATSSSTTASLQQKHRFLLLSDLQDHNAFFDNLVDMIPSKLYIAGNSGDDYNPKYYKGQNKESREARRAQIKATKRAKYDPALLESTSQAKKRMEEAKSASGGKNLLPQKNLSESKPPPKKGVAVDNGDDKKKEEAPLVLPTDNKSRIDALRAKLHAKIAEKGGNRPTDPSVVSKRAARRTEKQRRKEEAIKRKKSASTSTKVDGRSGNAQATSYTMGSGSKAGTAAQDLSQLDFGRLTGLNATAPNYKNNKALANLGGGKNLEKILADAEQKKAKLEELKRSENAEDKEKLKKIQWSDALKEASGERVKDDPAKIKSKLKRKAAKKAKSQKAWKSRMDQTKHQMDDRQKIRTHNLDQRKAGGKAGSNLSSKRIEEDKSEGNRESRRLSRPGFEGKKQGFLNEAKQQ